MGKSYPKTPPINMSHHFTPCNLNSCDCLKKARALVADQISGPARRTRSSSLRVEFSSPPASPLPELREVVEAEFSSPPASPLPDPSEVVSNHKIINIPLQSEQGEVLDQVAESEQQIGLDQAGDDTPDFVEESSQRHVFDDSQPLVDSQPMDDSQPMVVDEDANDGYERFVSDADVERARELIYKGGYLNEGQIRFLENFSRKLCNSSI